MTESETWIIGHRVQVWVLVALITLTSVVSLRGLPFDIFPAGSRDRGSGITVTVAETRRMMREWGLHEHERIAWVGRFRISTPVIAAPLHGLMGNAPLLSGLGSVHMFEPLENREAAQAHDNYSTPWRVTLDVPDYVSDRRRHNRRLTELGVTWLVSPYPNAFPHEARRVFRDRNGRSVYGMRLPPLQEGLTFPWGVTADGRRIALGVEAGGALRTADPLDAPPSVPVGRPLVWKRLPAGQWRGVVRIVDGYWFVAGAMALVASVWMLFVSNWYASEWFRPSRMS